MQREAPPAAVSSKSLAFTSISLSPSTRMSAHEKRASPEVPSVKAPHVVQTSSLVFTYGAAPKSTTSPAVGSVPSNVNPAEQLGALAMPAPLNADTQPA